jgi:DHA1 family multidrug resistance protein-like MFS transporter
MAAWKRNILILWIGNFMFFVGTSMIVPFLPIYVQELGVTDVKEAAIWASAIFAVNHLFLTIFSPIWGRITDIYGQKMILMLSGAAMGIVVFAMGFVRSPLDLLVLRMLFGIMGGFSVAAAALVAVETPKEQRGKTLGTMHTGVVCGQMIGPIFGGVLAATIGMRSAFYITGLFMLSSAVLVTLFVRETAVYSKLRWFRRDRDSASMDVPKSGRRKYSWFELLRYPMVPVMFLTSFLLMGCMQSIDPIMTLYIKSVISTDHVEVIGGLVFAASALGTMISAPLLGRLGDKRGHKQILIVSLATMAAVYVLQSMVHNPWQLMGLRFITGACIGGLMPSISASLSKLAPKHIQGGMFGLNSSALSLGSVCGAISGGLLANFFSFNLIFYVISALLALHSIFLFLLFRRSEREGSAGQKMTDFNA